MNRGIWINHLNLTQMKDKLSWPECNHNLVWLLDMFKLPMFLPATFSELYETVARDLYLL